MHTTATLPDHVELHEGEELDLRAVARNGTLVITRVLRSRMPSPPATALGALFSDKWGGSMRKIIDPDDARLTAINEKHTS